MKTETADYGSLNKQKLKEMLDIGESSSFSLLKRELYLNERCKYHIPGEVAVCITEEFRNSMTGIKGFLQFIMQQKGLITESKLDKYYQLMINEIQQMENIVSGLLLVNKPDGNQFVREDIVLLLKESLEKVKENSRIQLDLHVNSDLRLVKCIKEQVLQMFVYLFNSSPQLMAEDERLTINIEERDSLHLKVTIANENVFNSTARMERIEDMLKVMRSNGNGLPWTIILNIVNNYGGNIQAYRNENNGTIFEVVLPAESYKSLK